MEIMPVGEDDVVPDETLDTVDPDFEEAAYLRAFPDIAAAVRGGALPSGLAHFQRSGRAEGRLRKPEYRILLRAPDAAPVPKTVVDAMTISPSGSTLITGWTDDRPDPLTRVTLETGADSSHVWTEFPRLTRADVDRTLDAAGHRFGVLLVAAPTGASLSPGAINAGGPVFHFQSGAETAEPHSPVLASDADLRDLALAALPLAAPGEADPDVIYGILDQHVGVQIAALNRLIIDQARARRVVERVGPERGRYRGSVVTTLRGGVEQLVPRMALVATGRGAEDYESIIIITEQDRFEPLIRAARMAHAALGVSLTLVLSPGGDPAGLGEDTARDIARSDRLIFMDQNVFPRDPDWTVHHSALLDGVAEPRTRLMGGLLYHPDGTLAQAGYYFEQETSWVARADGVPHRVASPGLKRTSGPGGSLLTAARPVAAVPAAFMSASRAWIEQLGGFTRNYARAALEDVDLCLRATQQGVPPWVHPLPMWYFERRGPVRPEPSKGGLILNDWLLHRQWDRMITADLLGQHPRSLYR